MFGTVAKLRVKPGAEALLLAQARTLRPDNTPGSPRMRGWISTTVYRASRDPRELWMAVVFEDEESYRANAQLESQHQWYVRLRGCLETDPEWIDGDVLLTTAL
ncbi:MAG: antibiotic biosynthesis monooxygenase family protein [Dehalococcoidia bacterium]